MASLMVVPDYEAQLLHKASQERLGGDAKGSPAGNGGWKWRVAVAEWVPAPHELALHPI